MRISAYAAAKTNEAPEMAREPEGRLMLAVLEDALVCFQRGLESEVPDHRRHFWAVNRWVASTESDWLFSFENICTTLKLDPQYIRAGLREMKVKARMQGVASKQRIVRRERAHRRTRLCATATA
ncbi:MAG TPA: hypothetical protein VEC57_10375 [Candidatus Limnocylindrales bacterium]|nr:hypothetical protein [Candidatus Limnocylindrales bacterium]